MKSSYYCSIAAKFIQLQLFLTLVSLPILVYWGLPISLIAPIGNLIFTPFITVFLICASIIFFGELFYIPTTPVVWCLEKISTFWLWSLQYNSDYWLLYLSSTQWWLLLTTPIGGLLILHLNIKKRAWYTTLWLLLYTIVILLLLKYNSIKNGIYTINRFNDNVYLLHSHNHTLLIDPGNIRATQNNGQWLDYTLLPYLIKKIGTPSIDSVIMLSISHANIEMLAAYLKKISIKTIYLPQWFNRLPQKTNDLLSTIEYSVKSIKGSIIYINHINKIIDEKGSIIATIRTDGLNNNYKDAHYQSLLVEGQVDKAPFTLYAAKHRNINIKGLL